MNATHAPNMILAIIVVVSLSLAAGCDGIRAGRSPQNVEPPAKIKPMADKVDQGQARQKAVLAEYKAMQIPQLAQKLEADSLKSIEPFNSLAYREVVSRGPSAGRELASFVKNPDRSSFLTLVAVRKVNQDVYASISDKTRATILVDALRNSKSFNTWGLPHLYWEDSAKAIIELQGAAVDPLRSLLGDKREAPVWGGEEYQEYQTYKYRVNDYAWALLLAIQNKKVEIPTDPATRDKLISEELGRGAQPK